MGSLDRVPLLLIFAASLSAMLATSEIGRRLGARARRRGEENIRTLEAAMFGLLALMIGFTFAMALSRFEARREAVMNEANAIGATALRACLLPAPYNAETFNLLRDYVRLRLAIARHNPAPQELNAGIARSDTLQEQLWRQAMAGNAKADPSAPTWLLLEALNALFSSQQKRLAAFRNQVPDEVLMALYAIAALAIAFAGYAQSLRPQPSRLPVYLMSVLVCTVIILIEDIETQFTGYIAVDQQPLIDAAARLGLQ